jgi:predicted acyltransferase
VSTPAFVDKVTGQKRAYALDALRGIAILMMVLSSVEPVRVLNHLPSFMYHTQVPPPFFEFIPTLPGVSWVDMVFPFFLFSMGAAIPFAIGRRMEKGTPWHKLVGATLLRGAILSLFAFYVEHIRTGVVDGKYTAGMEGTCLQMFLIGTGGFLILFPALGRLPSNWSKGVRTAVKVAGWAAAIGLMSIVRYDPKVSLAHNSTFSLAKFDCIIMILANIAVYTTFAYMLTRKNTLLRIGVLGILMAMKLGATVPTGWVHAFQANFPIPYLSHMSFLGGFVTSILGVINSFFSLTITDYLFLSVTGTIIGDMIIKWMNTVETTDSAKFSWSKGRFSGLATLLFATTAFTLIMLKGRHVTELVICLIPLLAIANKLVSNPVNSLETLINGVYKWGMYMLAVGMLFEPYEGGIKKDPATMSYYFVAGGLAILMLLVFTIVIEVFNKKKYLQLLIDNGQNPMIAYTAGGNLIGTTLVVLGIHTYLKNTLTTPWPYFCYSVVFTLLVALSVSFCTRHKIFWRT